MRFLVLLLLALLVLVVIRFPFGDRAVPGVPPDPPEECEVVFWLAHRTLADDRVLARYDQTGTLLDSQAQTWPQGGSEMSDEGWTLVASGPGILVGTGQAVEVLRYDQDAALDWGWEGEDPLFQVHDVVATLDGETSFALARDNVNTKFLYRFDAAGDVDDIGIEADWGSPSGAAQSITEVDGVILILYTDSISGEAWVHGVNSGSFALEWSTQLTGAYASIFYPLIRRDPDGGFYVTYGRDESGVPVNVIEHWEFLTGSGNAPSFDWDADWDDAWTGDRMVTSLVPVANGVLVGGIAGLHTGESSPHILVFWTTSGTVAWRVQDADYITNGVWVTAHSVAAGGTSAVYGVQDTVKFPNVSVPTNRSMGWVQVDLLTGAEVTAGAFPLQVRDLGAAGENECPAAPA